MATPEQGNTAPEAARPYGEVFDRGYQHYAGERRGRSYAVRALTIYSIKRGLGIKKRWTAKILPIILYGISFIPAIVIVGLLAFLPAGELGIGYGSLYGTLELVILVFAAALAPEMLCDDRRENVLQLYFSRPITRLDYLGAKVGAMAILMGTIVFLPPLILFVGLTLVDASPVSYFFENIEDLLRIVVFGVLVSTYYASLGLIISLFTTRKGIAAAILIVGVVILSGLASGVHEAISDQSWRGYLVFASPFEYIEAMRAWIFGEDIPSNNIAASSNVPGILYAVATLAVAAVSMAVMRRQYLTEG